MSGTTDRADGVKNADFVVESVPEDLVLKRDIFAALDSEAPPEAILTSNTSSLSITAMAAVTRRPERVVGSHFILPGTVLPLVEVVRGDQRAMKRCRLRMACGSEPETTGDGATGYPGIPP